MREKLKKVNWIRVVWVSFLYIALIGILILTIIYKVKFER